MDSISSGNASGSDNNKRENITGAQPAQTSSSQKGNQPETFVVNHEFTPDLKSKYRHREQRKLQLLDCFYERITISHACAYVGVSLRTFYDWQATDKKFARAYDVCWQAVADRLFRRTYGRAMNGSDNLAMFLMKYYRPEMRDRVQTDIDPKIIDNLVNNLVDALKKTVPDNCPHCKTNLGLTDKVAKMLSNLSQGVAP